ncbi:MAG TPA: hypothetical protein PLV68_19900, partial [Ilumatobacteraceae bacterium]|nr:hypothetical protein [Ilumatobacteraceae bacterium]
SVISSSPRAEGFSARARSASFGMILSAISGLVAFAGAFLGFKESGGDFNDLKDINKIKGQFGGGNGGGTPPPPPGGYG